jgi:hypothetical protein
VKNLKYRLNRALLLVGPPGVIGLGLLIFSAGLYSAWIVPALKEVQAMQSKADAQQTRPGAQTGKRGPQEPLSEFYEFFPAVETAPKWLGRVYAIAEKQGLDLQKGEYRLTSNPQDRIVGYQAVFPVRGSYPQLRAFIVNSLEEFPIASMDDLRLERQRSAETAVDAQIKLTFFLRR